MQEAIDNALKDNLPMQPFVQKYGFNQVCDYTLWAYTESIDLKEEITDKVSID